MSSTDGPCAADLLVGLDEAQRRCVTTPAATVVIEAGAGAGKTRVLTRRVAYRARVGAADPARTMVVTFTRKAAGELSGRLADLGVDGVWCSTVHAAARKLLDQYWSDLGKPRRVLTANPGRVLAEALGPAWAGHLRLVARELAWARPRGIDASTYAAAAGAHRRVVPLPLDHMAHALALYDEHKRRRGVMDLEDLLPLCTEALGDPTFGDAVRWRVRHVAVDEAQDLDRAQWRFLRHLLGPSEDLCLVGDPQQSIYQWNGADTRFLTQLERVFPDAQRYCLETNYRSDAVIVSLASSLGGRSTPVEVTSEHTGTVQVLQHRDEQAEARQVVRWAREQRSAGAGWSQLAVLARTKALLEPVEQQLRAAGIPVRSGRALLDEPVVRQALGELGRVWHLQPARATAVDLAEIVEELLGSLARLGTAKRGQSDVTGQSEGSGQSDGFGQSDGSGQSDGFGLCRTASGDTVDDDDPSQPVQDTAGLWARARLEQLMALVDEWATAQPYAPGAHLMDWLHATLRTRGGEPGDPSSGVELATFHRAKGLEFDHVFLVGVEDGTVPLARSEHLEEERRLLYVAVTRARHSLTCSWASTRGGAGSSRAQAPSPWLAEIEAVANAGSRTGVLSARRDLEQVARLRARLTA